METGLAEQAIEWLNRALTQNARHIPALFNKAEALKKLHAYEKAQVDGFTGTDTGACVERYYPTIKAFGVDAESANLKITYAEDLALAKALLAQR